MAAISDELISAYRSTEYRVEVPGSEITLRIDEYSAPLAALYAAHGICSSAFLTAYNPFSKYVSSDANIFAQRTLLVELKARNLQCFKGVGVDLSGEWPPEQSVLVLAISRQEAFELARRYGQNGFVFTVEDAVPRLILTR